MTDQDATGKIAELRRQNWTATILAGAAIALATGQFVSQIIDTPAQAAAPPRELSIERLKVRSLTVVDDHGTERVVIAAPLPDPRILGHYFKRGEKDAGILLFDDEGNERGGYVTDDSGGAAITLDEAGRPTFLAAAEKRGNTFVRVFNRHPDSAIRMGLIPNGPYANIAQQDGSTVELAPRHKSDGAKQ